MSGGMRLCCILLRREVYVGERDALIDLSFLSVVLMISKDL
jgi:hypothetical protein